MTTAIAAHESVEDHAAQAHHDLALAVASVNAFACPGETVLAEPKSRWQVTEEDILRASFTVILVALMAVISVSAGAILTMS